MKKRRLKVFSTLALATLFGVGISTLVSCGTSTSTTSDDDTSETTTTTTTDDDDDSSSSSSSSSSDTDTVTLSVDTTDATTTFVVGDTFTYDGIVVTTSDGTTISEGTDEGEYTVYYDEVDMDTVGTYTVTIACTYDGSTITTSYEISVVSEITEDISSVDDFLEAREYSNSEGINNISYTLTCDLDLDGITLDDEGIIFAGTFDGGGYTIENATFTPSGSKEGMLFDKIEGGTVENVKFFNCSVAGGSAESAGLLFGLCDSDGATFSNIEFSMCTLDNSGQNYAGLLFARNTGSTVDVVADEITVKNLSSVTCAQYGGMLTGDLISGSTFTLTNSDINGTFTTASGGGYLTGRNRGADVDVENTIVRGEIDGGSTSTGFITGGSSTEVSSITLKNVLLYDVTGDELTNDAFLAKTTGTSETFENVYYTTLPGSATNTIGATQVDSTDIDSDWMLNTLGLSSDYWEADDNSIIKLINSSSNTPSDDATVVSLIIVTTSVTTQFSKDSSDAFSYDGLVVSAEYSDGTVIAITDYTVTVADSSGNSIYNGSDSDDYSDFYSNDTGTYVVTITYEDVTESYDVTLVSVDGITVTYDQTQTVFSTSDSSSDLDTDDIIVFNTMSDGTSVLATLDDDYTVTIYNSSDTECDFATMLATAGTYTITVTSTVNDTYTYSFTIYVVDSTDDETDGTVTVYVDSSYTTGSTYESTGDYEFSTIAKALDYLDSCDLDEDVIKTIYVAAGTYEEKLTIDIPNLRLISTGDSYEDTIITYSVAAGSTTEDGTSTYGTYSSATVYVTSDATGFIAEGIYFRNDFDYTNSTLSSKQAVALRCDADEAIFYSCGFYGNQDTLFANTGRQYYYNCYIAGSVDYIFGTNATAVFSSCTINTVTRYDSDGSAASNNGYVCATKGYSSSASTDAVTYNFIFLDSTFTADSDVAEASESIARPWGDYSSVVSIGCSFTNAYATAGYDGDTKSRYADMSGNLPTDSTVYFAEYDNTGDGAVSSAVTGMTMLTADEAAVYEDLDTVFAATNGDVTYDEDWNPATLISEGTDYSTYVTLYTQAATSYVVGDTYEASTIYAYQVTGSILGTLSETELTSSDYTITYTNSSDVTVTSSEAMETADTYTEEITYNDTVLASGTFTVSEEVTLTSFMCDFTTLTASGDKEEITEGTAFTELSSDGTTSVEGSGSIVTYGTVKKRTNSDGSVKAIEFGKLSSGLAITVSGACTIEFEATSTSSSNTSDGIGLFDSDSSETLSSHVTAITADGTTESLELQEVNSSNSDIVFVFTVDQAGTYYLSNANSDTNGRGFRAFYVSITY